MTDFRRHRVWHLAVQVGAAVDRATRRLPRGNGELAGQLRKAALSISGNIAEGSDRGSDREFARYLHMAKGSASEVQSGLAFAAELGAITRQEQRAMTQRLELVRTMLDSLIETLGDDPGTAGVH